MAEDDRYEIISIPGTNTGTYVNYVINKSGRIMKNTKVKTDNDTELRTNQQGILTFINGSADGVGNKYVNPKEPSV